MIKLEVTPLTPDQFRVKHRLSRKEMVKMSGLKLETLKNYLAPPDSSRHSEPPESIQILFGLLDEKLTKMG